MLLAIDAGNTNIVFGIHRNGEWIHEWRFNTIPVQRPFVYEKFLRENFLEADLPFDELEGIVISSVVPQANDMLKELSAALIEGNAVFIDPSLFPLLPVRTHKPYQIGTDLIANAVAAKLLHGGDTIVVDFGTALTFTVVNKEGLIEGVNIAPGLKTAIKALVGQTAQLPDVPLELPDSVLGKDTVHAIQNGVLWGYVSMVEGMLNRIEKELGRPMKVVATGGLSSILHPLHERFQVVNKHLTLEGLRLIHELVKSK